MVRHRETCNSVGIGIFRSDYMFELADVNDAQNQRKEDDNDKNALNGFSHNGIHLDENTHKNQTRSSDLNGADDNALLHPNCSKRYDPRQDKLQLKQVEFNTMAIGAGGMVTGLRDTHRLVLAGFRVQVSTNYDYK